MWHSGLIPGLWRSSAWGSLWTKRLLVQFPVRAHAGFWARSPACFSPSFPFSLKTNKQTNLFKNPKSWGERINQEATTHTLFKPLNVLRYNPPPQINPFSCIGWLKEKRYGHICLTKPNKLKLLVRREGQVLKTVVAAAIDTWV